MTSSAMTQDKSNQQSRTNNLPRPTSPSPSVASEQTDIDKQQQLERDEISRKQRIQLYVYVSRCIAYPFNAKQPTDMTRRNLKVTKQQLNATIERFASFLRGEIPMFKADDVFREAVQSYHDVFLKSDRVVQMVEMGSCTQYDMREVFRNNIEKRVG